MMLAVLFAVLCAPLAGDPDPAIARAPGAPDPVALHLSSFGSMRAARIGADGTLDGGASTMQLLDGAGAPLPVEGLAYGPRPDCWVEWSSPAGELTAKTRALAMPVSRGGDERVKGVMRVVIANKPEKGTVGETKHVKIGASLRAGSGDPLQRPFPSIDFDPAATWKQEENWISRDGRVVFGWAGTDAVVTVHEHVAAAGDEVARLAWEFDVTPGNARLLELFVLGPPARLTVDESALREGLERATYQTLEEQLGWQTERRGTFADIVLHDTRLWFAVVSPIEYLRSLGVGDRDARQFSDRLYGHPASDGAVEPEILGIFAEWGFAEWQVNLLQTLLTEAVSRGQGLSPERRVALAHGLARMVRLGSSPEDHDALAAVIHTLLDKSTEGAQVRPWLDPERVRQDLQAVLDEAAPSDEYTLPHFAWATPEPGSTAAEFLTIRHALSAHDGAAAWAHLTPLVVRSSENALGSMVPGATPDAEYQMGFLSLFRDMLFDDHGQDLHLFPAVPVQMVPPTGLLEIPTLPTRCGSFECQQFYSGRKGYGARVLRHNIRGAGDVLLHLVAGLSAAAVVSPAGGIATLLPDGTISCEFDTLTVSPKGLRFNIKLTQPPER